MNAIHPRVLFPLFLLMLAGECSNSQGTRTLEITKIYIFFSGKTQLDVLFFVPN